MIKRALESKIRELATKFPALAIIGPRQSGKTTLTKEIFPHLPYVSLEDLDVRSNATKDPRSFIESYPDGVILDEVQNTPDLFSYLQSYIDKSEQCGKYILTGSQNLMFLENISQSLSGRISTVTLLPLSFDELSQLSLLPDDAFELIINGFYPRIYKNNIHPDDWYSSYITTYVERDIRRLQNIQDLTKFQTFIQLCAGRIGQLLNYSSLANDCGVAVNTIKSWISILEASFIIFLLKPHHENFNKRLVKSPKLYFYDTGLACSLLEIENKKQLSTHYLRGSLFENLVIAEMAKIRFNKNKKKNLFFWRDQVGHEVDIIFQHSDKKIPIEIKSSKTYSNEFISSISYWNTLSKNENGVLIYNGEMNQSINSIHILNWKNTSMALETLICKE